MDRRRLIAQKRNRLRAGGDVISTARDTPVELFPFKNDHGRNLRITAVDNHPIVDGGAAVPVLHGQVDLDGGMLTFTPDSLYVGVVSFTYTVVDGQQSRIATVTGTVT